jgi:hypothetical protein
MFAEGAESGAGGPKPIVSEFTKSEQLKEAEKGPRAA